WTYTYTIDNASSLTPPSNGTETVECPADAVDPGAPADLTDACGNTISATFVSEVSNPDPITCNATVVFTYEYEDCNGTTYPWTYTYTIDNTSSLTLPSNGTENVECPAD